MTELLKSQVFATAMGQIEQPISDMLRTGFFVEPQYVRGETLFTSAKIRPLARKVAREMKRPFICVTPMLKMHPDDEEKPWNKMRWVPRGYGVAVPKRAYLEKVVAPLLVAAHQTEAPVYRIHQNPQHVIYHHLPARGSWSFSIFDTDFWDEYFTSVQNDAEMRKALRLSH
jgi:hypothetical protein